MIITKVVFGDGIPLEAKQLGVVALFHGELGDALVGQGVVVVVDTDVLQLTQHVSFA